MEGETSQGPQHGGGFVLDDEEIDNFLAFTGVQVPKPNSIFIMVMGMTGAGKSSFISAYTGRKVQIGHDLVSCTSGLAIFSVEREGRIIYLIDTPGFDDTNRSDIETLRSISHYLSISYANRVSISGILYLHRVSDNRMTGTCKRNISMLKALVGPDAYPNLVIATTMWSPTEHDLCVSRETELHDRPDFFGDLVAEDIPLLRHCEWGLRVSDANQSAAKIIDVLLKRAAGSSVTLQIQSEMVDERRSLEETEAGKCIVEGVGSETTALRQELEHVGQELREALSVGQDTAKDLKQLQKEMQNRISDVARSEDKLKADLLAIHYEEKRKLEQRLDAMEKAWIKELAAKEEASQESQVRLRVDEEQIKQSYASKSGEHHHDSHGQDHHQSTRQSTQELKRRQARLAQEQEEFALQSASVSSNLSRTRRIRDALGSGLASGVASGTMSAVLTGGEPKNAFWRF